jgi:hypothetical protein
MRGMTPEAVQELCEAGQEKLMRMDYLGAEAALAEAESHAWSARDWDTLSRLYMPLQESRRQRHLRCGEGVVALDLISQGPDDHVNGRRIAENYPHGQLLVAGWGTIEPALKLRELQPAAGLFVETFLGAAYPVGGSRDARVVAIVPHEGVRLPSPDPDRPLDDLVRALPAHSIVMPVESLPRGGRPGSTETFAYVSALWERLHLPFLAAADMQADPVQKIEHYRKTIGVDYACELAHQKLSDVARGLLRRQRAPAT